MLLDRRDVLIALSAGLGVAIDGVRPASATTIVPCRNPDRNALLAVAGRGAAQLEALMQDFGKRVHARPYDVGEGKTVAQALMRADGAWSMLLVWSPGDREALVTFDGAGLCTRPLSTPERKTWAAFLELARARGFRPRLGVPSG